MVDQKTVDKYRGELRQRVDALVKDFEALSPLQQQKFRARL